MNSLGKLVAGMGLAYLVSVMPLAAQVGNGAKFTTTFPFYVGSTEMPAGTYIISQPGSVDIPVLRVRSNDTSHSALIMVMSTESLTPSRQSLVIFEKYGNTLYFNRVSLQGSTSGVAAVPTKAEKKAEETASVIEERSIVAYGL